jgi:type IV pilus assembly protein PilM
MAHRRTGPALACELAADRVIAARAAAAGTLAQYNVRRLAAGTLHPGLTAINVANRDVLHQAISEALAVIDGGARSRDVIAIVPDAAVRIVLLDFDTLPEDRAEAEPIIRFRMKKSLPFDVEHAAVSYHAQPTNDAVRVVAAISPRAVIDDYEAAFRAAGYEPGVVVPSVLATLGLVIGDRPTMLVKVDVSTTSIVIVDHGDLLLLRTLDHPSRTEVSPEQLVATIHPSMVFFEDTYASRIESLLLTGTSSVTDVVEGLRGELGISVQALAAVAGSFGEGYGERVTPSTLTAVAGALA